MCFLLTFTSKKLFLFKGGLMDGIKKVKARYENCTLKIEEPLQLKEGEEVEVIIVPKFSKFKGILKYLNIDSVSLQHLAKEYWTK